MFFLLFPSYIHIYILPASSLAVSFIFFRPLCSFLFFHFVFYFLFEKNVYFFSSNEFLCDCKCAHGRAAERIDFDKSPVVCRVMNEPAPPQPIRHLFNICTRSGEGANGCRVLFSCCIYGRTLFILESPMAWCGSIFTQRSVAVFKCLLSVDSSSSFLLLPSLFILDCNSLWVSIFPCFTYLALPTYIYIFLFVSIHFVLAPYKKTWGHSHFGALVNDLLTCEGIPQRKHLSIAVYSGAATFLHCNNSPRVMY